MVSGAGSLAWGLLSRPVMNAATSRFTDVDARGRDLQECPILGDPGLGSGEEGE